MTTQTEKLQGRLGNILATYELRMRTEEPRVSMAISEILQACKEEGLKFTEVGVKGDALEGACICRVVEI